MHPGVEMGVELRRRNIKKAINIVLAALMTISAMSVSMATGPASSHLVTSLVW